MRRTFLVVLACVAVLLAFLWWRSSNGLAPASSDATTDRPAPASTTPGARGRDDAPGARSTLASPTMLELVQTVSFPDHGTIRCAKWPELSNGVHGYLTDARGGLGIVKVTDGYIYAIVPPGEGAGTVVFPGQARGTLRWHAVEAGRRGVCDSAVALGTSSAGIHGTLVGEAFGDATVNGCGGSAPVTDGTFFLAVEPDARCTLAVVVFERGRLARGPSVDVTTSSAADSEVRLAYPRRSELHPYDPKEIEGMRERLESLEEDCAGGCEPLVTHLRAELEDAERALAGE